MLRCPRSVALPMLLTVLTLVGLTVRVARFHEHFTIMITKPAATDPPMVVRSGQIIEVEGLIDAGQAVYHAVNVITISLISKDSSFPGGQRTHGYSGYHARYDPNTKRFRGRVFADWYGPRSVLSLVVEVVDTAGRTHSFGDGRGTSGNEVLLRVEPTISR
jgi:hypothetical protein